MALVTVPVTELNAAEYNPRKDLQPGDPEYEKIKRSVETFGYVDPLVWNKRTGRLVGGHQRLKVLIHEYGVTEVDVSVVDLPVADEKALNVALNKVTGDWDTPRLAELLIDLQNDDSIDETLTGFDENEIRPVLKDSLMELEIEETEQGEGKSIDETFSVLVNCKDEADQKKVYETMESRGYTCRVLTI